MSIPLPCITDIRNAYEGHDRDALEHVLVRISATLMACVSPGAVKGMSQESLELHRSHLHVQLAEVDDELHRRDLIRHGQAVAMRVTADENTSLDPSDETMTRWFRRD